MSDKVTAFAGSSLFFIINMVWFVSWILINTGQFGSDLIFDKYPFGLLTTAVSLEAIVLSIFVLISQNRQSERSELRSELDYITDLQADAEIDIIITMLERIAAKQEIDMSDLVSKLKSNQKQIVHDHPATANVVKD